MESLAENRGMDSIRVPLPAGALDIPFPHERVLHHEAGLYLDRLLRPLARVSGAIDRAMALATGKDARAVRLQAVGVCAFRGLRTRAPGTGRSHGAGDGPSGQGSGATALAGCRACRGARHVDRRPAGRPRGEDGRRGTVGCRWREQLSVRELQQKVAEALASAAGAKPGEPATSGSLILRETRYTRRRRIREPYQA